MKNSAVYSRIVHAMSIGYAWLKVFPHSREEGWDYELLEMNPAFERLTGLKARDAVGRNVLEFFPRLEKSAFQWQSHCARVIARQEECRVEAFSEILHGWYQAHIFPVSEDQVVLFLSDITREKEREELLKRERAFFRKVIDTIPGFVCVKNREGYHTLANETLCRAYGKSLGEIEGHSDAEQCPTPEEVRRFLLDDRWVMEHRKPLRIPEEKITYADGTVHWHDTIKVPLVEPDDSCDSILVVALDMTERKERRHQIEYLSNHDHLTGLYNRRSMEAALEELDGKGVLPLAIVVVDVNGLKLTNDAFGYAMGDRLLQAAAAVLREACEGECVVGRMGGDEFLVLFPGEDAARAERFMQCIRQEASRVFFESVILSLAAGCAVKEEPGQDLGEIRVQAENAMRKNKLKYGRIMRSQTVERVLTHINIRYDREQIHTERVAEYSEALARALGCEEHDVEIVKTAAVLHDIGKIMVPAELLNKAEPLSEEEFALIRRHPETGYQILKSVEEYAGFAEYVLYHHERWDGAGYPEGLKGEDIPFVSRIIAVADAYEAMTASRPYQKKKTASEAVLELRRCGGTQFDPRLAEVFAQKVLLG